MILCIPIYDFIKTVEKKFCPGTSIRTDPQNRKMEGIDQQKNLKQWPVCCYCNQAVPRPGQDNSCKIHCCSYRYIAHPRKGIERVDSDPGPVERIRSQFVEIPSEREEQTTFCTPSCCSGLKITEDSFTPATPEATGSNSSEENRTEYFPQTTALRK